MKNSEKENLDKILIKDLVLKCILGVNEVERKVKQNVAINIVIWSDFTEAVNTDDIRKTVNYKDVKNDVTKLVEKSEFFLVETLAEKIAQICLRHERVNKVKVSVEKPSALSYARSVGVELVRKKVS